MRLIITDLEATCWMRQSPPKRMEIIEIGAVRLDGALPAAGKQGEFASFVRPVRQPKLSAFCMGLTGIRQRDVDGADEFPVVFARFLKWIGTKSYRLSSWGMYDLLQFRTDCARHGIPVPPEFSSHINLKAEFARIKGVRPCGVKRAMGLAGLTLQGRHHRALDDARNIARLTSNIILPALSTAS